MKDRYVVIMAGGRGERFWPASRLSRPKHLLPIVGDKPMLTQTVERIGPVCPPERVIVITNREQRTAVLEVCPNIPPENVVAEPVGRDTAAAVGLAAILVKHRSAQASFAMLPADHVIHDVAAFQAVLEGAFAAAESAEQLVTVGIKPDHPATGYGYIRRGEPLPDAAGCAAFAVRQFREKPDEATARAYLESGEYYWNAGMFFWTVPVIAAAFARHAPSLWQALGAIERGLAEGQPLEALLDAHYPTLEKISVDYAIMEKAERVAVVESRFDWDDVGAWPAVARHFPKDAAGNVSRGAVRVMDTRNSIVFSTADHLTAVIGVDDLIVVHTGDATLVCPIDRAQEIKELVRALGTDEALRRLT